MNRPQIALAALVFTLSGSALHAQQWTPPTPEELSMTALPQVPGATALYLYKEQKTDDSLHMQSFYYRVKVLSEGGKELANVELPYFTGASGYQVSDISGRTIQPDGTVVMFSGKPYEKLVARTGGMQEKSKVFTLPAVQVGSILEYRYTLRWDDHLFVSPDWYLQGDLYVRRAHYSWKPTTEELIDDKGKVSNGIVSWTPVLPEGAKVVQTTAPGNNRYELTLDVHDIAPIVKEADMPPLESVSYRVMFYYSNYKTYGDFWKENGKSWSKDRDKFIGPNGAVKEYAATLVSPGDPEQVKADKLYAAVMTFENTDFTREHSTREDKAQGLRQVSNAGDIVQRKRGSSDQLAETYVALARAAGLKAYVMGVADRDQRLFLPQYMSLRQIDDLIAIVNIGGKDVFYDPGERYCEAGHLAWNHAGSGGIRQIDGGSTLGMAPMEPYRSAHVSRIADLVMDEHGRVDGKVTMTFTGPPALRWRHVALRTDEGGLKSDLREMLEKLLPGGMEIEVKQVDNVADYTKPLEVHYEVRGGVGTVTGKRLLVPADLFVINEKPRFPQQHREIPIDIHYASMTQDAVRLKLPDSLTIESAPEPEKASLAQIAAYSMSSKKSGNSITVYRDVSIGSPLFFPKEYPDLRAFYGKLETRDQDTLVLTRAGASASAQVGGAPSTK